MIQIQEKQVNQLDTLVTKEGCCDRWGFFVIFLYTDTSFLLYLYFLACSLQINRN